MGIFGLDSADADLLGGGIGLVGGLVGGLVNNASQAANNANMLSAQWQRDQFNAQQVAMNNATNWNWTQQTNQENRDFIWQTNLQNEAFQRETNLWNAAQVQKQMDFQERMSSTAYQRAMADMRKAGLNPILAYQQGGASSMPGAAPVGIAPKNVAPQYQSPRSEAFQAALSPRTEAPTGLGNAISGMATSALDAIQKMATVDKTQQEAENLKKNYDQIVETIAKTKEETVNIKAATLRIISEIENNVAYNRVLKANGITAEQDAVMKGLEIADAQRFGTKLRPDASEQLYRGLLSIAEQIASYKPGDPLPKLKNDRNAGTIYPDPTNDPGHWRYKPVDDQRRHLNTNSYGGVR